MAILFEYQLAFVVVIVVLATAPVYTTLDKESVRYHAAMYIIKVLPFPCSYAFLQPLSDEAMI